MNTGLVAAHAAPRCDAKGKRSGKPCQAPKLHGRPRCRLHGGRSGRKPTHGRYTREARELRTEMRDLLRDVRGLLAISE